MKDLIKSRLDKLTEQRDEYSKRVTEFYSSPEYLATPRVEREALEARHDMPRLTRKLWEINRRASLLEGAVTLPSDEAAIEYLGLMSTGARQHLEKGLVEGSGCLDFLEFLGRGVELEECTHLMTSRAIVADLRERKQARENARKGA